MGFIIKIRVILDRIVFFVVVVVVIRLAILFIYLLSISYLSTISIGTRDTRITQNVSSPQKAL